MAAEKVTGTAPPAASKQTLQSGPNNVIAAGCRVKGDLILSGSLRLGGEVLGDVSCDGTLIVEAGGQIKGRVHAADIVIKGRIIGEIAARRRIEVGTGGHAEGSIFAPSMSVEGNAHVDGDLLIAPERTQGHLDRAKSIAVLKASEPAPAAGSPASQGVPAGS